MKWRRDHSPERIPGEYPESFVRGFMARALPSATPAQAASAVRHLRSKGWTEEQLAEFILPFMPRDAGASAQSPRAEPPRTEPPRPEPPRPEPPPAPRARPGLATQPPSRPSTVPADVTPAWLHDHLPAMDRREMRLVVDELERRGWRTGTVAVLVLPHLLPKLPGEEASAIIAGLARLGMTEDEIARATTVP